MEPSPAPKQSKRHRFLNRIQGVFQSVPHPPSAPSRSTPDLTQGNDSPSPRPPPSPDLLAIVPAQAQIRGPAGEWKVPSTSNFGPALSTATTASLAIPAASATANKPNEAWSVARSGLEATLRVLERSADAFPPLKSAIGGLVACLDIIQASHIY
jgi:hypothetical protein